MTFTIRDLDRAADRAGVEAIDTTFETHSVFDVVTSPRRIELVERTLARPLAKLYSIAEVFAAWARWDTGWVADDGGVRGFATVEYEDRDLPREDAVSSGRAVRAGPARTPSRIVRGWSAVLHGSTLLAVSAWWAVIAACGPSSPPARPPAPIPTPRVDAPPAEPDEQARHDELAAAHRKLEEEQQQAYAATCDEPEPRVARPRCLPSCYPTEPADARAGKKLAGAVELRHVVCEQPGGTFAIMDELGGAQVAPRRVRGRFQAGHKKGTWQGELEAAVAPSLRPKLARGDVLRVAGRWRGLAHPLTRERLRCVTVAHVTKVMRRALDGCGADGTLACEATGNAAARGINVVHYRLAEARRLQEAGKSDDCQQAALEAVAVARGLPRWRQYMKLNVAAWVDYPGYRTRFDGTLDEDALFATAASLGNDAAAVYAACGGPAEAPTTVAQEQSFHTCW